MISMFIDKVKIYPHKCFVSDNENLIYVIKYSIFHLKIKHISLHIILSYI